MKMIKKINVGGAYARKEPYEYEGQKFEADIQNGDTVKILSEGDVVVGQYGEQQVFKIETRNGEKNFTINQKSVNILIGEFGEDSKDWVGREVRVILKKDVIANRKVIIAYVVSGDWQLDEYGDLINPSKVEEEEIDPKDQPF